MLGSKARPNWILRSLRVTEDNTITTENCESDNNFQMVENDGLQVKPSSRRSEAQMFEVALPQTYMFPVTFGLRIRKVRFV